VLIRVAIAPCPRAASIAVHTAKAQGAECPLPAIVGIRSVRLGKRLGQTREVLVLGVGVEYHWCRGKNMRNGCPGAILIFAFAASLLSEQPPNRRLVQPPSRSEIVPPGFLEDRDPVIVDPQHFKVDFQNEQVRVVHLSMKGTEETRMHEEPAVLAVCIKECHVRLSEPDGKTKDLNMQDGDTHWIWEDIRSEKNLSKEPLEMLLIEMKAKPRLQADRLRSGRPRNLCQVKSSRGAMNPRG
jgi:hypothetical protein